MKNQKTIAAIILLTIVTLLIVVILLGWFFLNPNMEKVLSASLMGAEYLGDQNVVLQTKYNNCGPSALKMIFDHYHITSTLDEIENNVSLNTNGSSMLALKEMAELKGLKTEGWILTLSDFASKQFPILLFVHGNHFVVADSVVKSEVFIRDPGIGRLKMNKNKLLNIWHGETLIFH